MPDYDKNKEMEMLLKRFNKNNFYGDINCIDRFINGYYNINDIVQERMYKISVSHYFTKTVIDKYYEKYNFNLKTIIRSAHKFLDKWEKEHLK